jgi:hypothetical protein
MNRPHHALPRTPAHPLVLDSVAASGKDNTTALVIQVG